MIRPWGEALFRKAADLGRAVQVGPFKPTSKALESERLKLEHQNAFKLCFQNQLAPLHLGDPGGRAW